MSLGETRAFCLRGDEGPIKAQFFIRHDGIRYLSPLTQTLTDVVHIVAEAPGRFTLYARWRDAMLGAGTAQIDFDVVGLPATTDPELVNLDQWTQVWAPNRWEAAMWAAHEPRSLNSLLQHVKSGDTVYDVGAHIGFFAMQFARRVGGTGQVYCFEPNPLCVYFLRANLSKIGSRNFDIIPVCVSDSRGTLEFTLNYGNNLLGVGQDSPMADKLGHKIRVESGAIDSLVEELDLRPPHLIKVDVEGAEGFVVAGMLSTLRRHRPILFIELHGRSAANKALEQLRPLGYRYREMQEDRAFASVDSLIDWFPDACLQVIGLP